MGEELQRSIHEPDSALQMFLKFCPDALERLLDRLVPAGGRPSTCARCLMRPMELDIRGKTFFDFFLFSPNTLKVIYTCHTCSHAQDGGDPEMSLISTLIEAKRTKFLLHPIFKLFRELKWIGIRRAFNTVLFITVFYQVTFFVDAPSITCPSDCSVHLHASKVLFPQGSN